MELAELQYYIFDGTAAGIANFETQSKKSDFGHLIPLIILTIIGIYLIGIGKLALGIFTLIKNGMLARGEVGSVVEYCLERRKIEGSL